MLEESNEMHRAGFALQVCSPTQLSLVCRYASRNSSLFVCYKLQSLVHQAVQILHFLAIDTGRPLYQQGSCRHKQSHLSICQSSCNRTCAALNTLSKIQVRASLKRKGDTFQNVLRTGPPSLILRHVRDLSSYRKRVKEGLRLTK